MADFEIAVAIVLEHEGAFANNKNDNGGPTNWGISTPVYSAFLGRPATLADVQAMPIEVARKIYKRNYWNVTKAEAILSQDVANLFMDMSVLRGVVAASKSMQTALGLKSDGIIGNVSLAAINAQSPAALMLDFQRECVLAFCRIAKANPTQLEFLSNWCGRVLGFNPIIKSMIA